MNYDAKLIDGNGMGHTPHTSRVAALIEGEVRAISTAKQYDTFMILVVYHHCLGANEMGINLPDTTETQAIQSKFPTPTCESDDRLVSPFVPTLSSYHHKVDVVRVGSQLQ